jgi:hypothetical protein
MFCVQFEWHGVCFSSVCKRIYEMNFAPMPPSPKDLLPVRYAVERLGSAFPAMQRAFYHGLAPAFFQVGKLQSVGKTFPLMKHSDFPRGILPLLAAPQHSNGRPASPAGVAGAFQRAVSMPPFRAPDFPK